MLGTSIILLTLLGFSTSSMFTADISEEDGDETEDNLQNAESEDNLAEMETVPLDTFLPPADFRDDVQDFAPNTESQLESVHTENDDETKAIELDAVDRSSIANVLVQIGGPGDTLTGTTDVEDFVVTLGGPGSEPTIIENLFLVSDDDDDDDDEIRQRAPETEVIWLKDQEGELLSRADILEKNVSFVEDTETNELAINFEDHQKLIIKGLTLAEFTENSLVIGNFGYIKI